MASEKKIVRYWVLTAEGAKLWFQNGLEFLNYVKGMSEFAGGNEAMTLDEWKAIAKRGDPRP